MTELFFKKEVYNIVGAAMEIHRVMGPGIFRTCVPRDFCN